jgi:N-acetyl-alpha-D-muramate 1-phosphate uridylyltransferase
MKAMILAAGRGERMRPLTDRVPKPLLEAGGEPLIVRLIAQLARTGFTDLVVNVSHLGELIEARLGNGAALGVTIAYSREKTALDTGGGIAYALALLGAAPFAVVNSDIHCDFDFARLRTRQAALLSGAIDAHLVLVDNPPHHPAGDFHLGANGTVATGGSRRLTFSGIGVYSPALFAALERGARCPLTALIAPAIARGGVSAEHHRGAWLDVGAPERLAALERRLLEGDDRR